MFFIIPTSPNQYQRRCEQYEKQQHIWYSVCNQATETTKKDQATVFARISVNGRRCEISLKLKVNPKNWDEAKGKARGTKEDIRKLNEHIERVRTLIADGYHDLVQQKKVVTVDAVKSLFSEQMKMG